MGDSPLSLNLAFKMNVSGTFQMGTAAAPISSPISVYIPGGNSAAGIFVTRGAKYDVHGVTQVGWVGGLVGGWVCCHRLAGPVLPACSSHIVLLTAA